MENKKGVLKINSIKAVNKKTGKILEEFNINNSGELNEYEESCFDCGFGENQIDWDDYDVFFDYVEINNEKPELLTIAEKKEEKRTQKQIDCFGGCGRFFNEILGNDDDYNDYKFNTFLNGELVEVEKFSVMTHQTWQGHINHFSMTLRNGTIVKLLGNWSIEDKKEKKEININITEVKSGK